MNYNQEIRSCYRFSSSGCLTEQSRLSYGGRPRAGTIKEPCTTVEQGCAIERSTKIQLSSYVDVIAYNASPLSTVTLLISYMDFVRSRMLCQKTISAIQDPKFPLNASTRSRSTRHSSQPFPSRKSFTTSISSPCLPNQLSQPSPAVE